MSQSATPPISCFSPLSLPIDARFDGPQLTSDGGLVWLAEADAALGLCAALTTQLPDSRTGPVRHSLEILVRQRIFQIAYNYEDQNDADTLRSDRLLKLVCGRLPGDPDLASPRSPASRTPLTSRPATGRPGHSSVSVWPSASSPIAPSTS